MTAPAPLIEFFQQEATEYLDQLDQVLANAEHALPDVSAFVVQARALRGSATMTRLEGLPELAATIERIAQGLRAGELRWDQRLLFAVRGALAELRDLIGHAERWSETEQRRCRTQSVALAAVAAGYLIASPQGSAPVQTNIVPIARLFFDDGQPSVLQRSPNPPITIVKRFRNDMAAGGAAVAQEARAFATTRADERDQSSAADTLRRVLLSLAATADSYGAASIAALATRMARSSLATSGAAGAVQAFAQLLMDRELTDQELAAQVKSAANAWSTQHGTPAASQEPVIERVRTPMAQPAQTPAASQDIVAVDTLLYRGEAALVRAREVRDALKTMWNNGDGRMTPESRRLFAELSDLLDLASR